MPARQAEQFRGFIITVARYLLSEKSEPAAMLRAIEESVIASPSSRGLKDATRDMLEWSRDVLREQLAELDGQLLAASDSKQTRRCLTAG
jgi:hypothetical protein